MSGAIEQDMELFSFVKIYMDRRCERGSMTARSAWRPQSFGKDEHQ